MIKTAALMLMALLALDAVLPLVARAPAEDEPQGVAR